MSRKSIVLFNLGGPDSLDAVKPFLKNLFSDPAIIKAPGLVRWCLARFISSRRAPLARAIYAEMGGRSPIVPETEAQAEALVKSLQEKAPQHEWQAVIAMRYRHPFADAAARAVHEFGPDEIILLPLYPQYSTTTTGSSVQDWMRAAREAGIDVPTTTICCYADEPGFVMSLAAGTIEAVRRARETAPDAPVHVLFSAHGLPKRVIESGDPYQWQVERTVAAVRAALDGDVSLDAADYVTCYQSRVGPLEWIGPAADAAIEAAAKAGAAIVVVPVAFVSEHSETLVELDIEYRKLAEKAGAAAYERVPAVGTGLAFIDGLARQVIAVQGRGGIQAGGKKVSNTRVCPQSQSCCALAE
ncbi:MAG: ferrochelatase [Rhodospirillales bacterium]|nr:ferrochelatase [Rhodospirillales bacterium]